jgi:hypothetical protein
LPVESVGFSNLIGTQTAPIKVVHRHLPDQTPKRPCLNGS